MPIEWLREIAANADDLYDPFVVRRGAKSRIIDRPRKTLRKTQRRIYRALLREYPFPAFVRAGVPSRSLMSAVRRHVQQPVVVTADVKNFYPSVTDDAVFSLWRRLGHGEKVSGLLTRLATRNHHLPQGAPTSLALANLLLAPVDIKMFAELTRAFPDIRYSRWVDDMIFSGSLEPSVVYEIVARHLKAVGLSLHRGRTKRRVMSAGTRQEILGSVVNHKPTLSRQRRSLIRAIVHNVKNHGGELAVVRGHIQYLRSFHLTLADQLNDSIALAPILFKRHRHTSERQA